MERDIISKSSMCCLLILRALNCRWYNANWSPTFLFPTNEPLNALNADCMVRLCNAFLKTGTEKFNVIGNDGNFAFILLCNPKNVYFHPFNNCTLQLKKRNNVASQALVCLINSGIQDLLNYSNLGWICSILAQCRRRERDKNLIFPTRCWLATVGSQWWSFRTLCTLTWYISSMCLFYFFEPCTVQST